MVSRVSHARGRLGEERWRAVSEENVEVIRRSIEAFNRPYLDGILQTYAPDAEADFSRSPGVEAGIYHGRQEIRDFWSTFFETWERAIVSADEYIDCGQSVLVPTGRAFGVGAE